MNVVPTADLKKKLDALGELWTRKMNYKGKSVFRMSPMSVEVMLGEETTKISSVQLQGLKARPLYSTNFTMATKDIKVFWEFLLEVLPKKREIPVRDLYVSPPPGSYDEDDPVYGTVQWDLMIDVVCTLLVDLNSPLDSLRINGLENREKDKKRVFGAMTVPTCSLLELYIRYPSLEDEIFLEKFSETQKQKMVKQDGILTLLSVTDKSESVWKLHAHMVRKLYEFL